MITQDRLKELLDYDPESGDFTWRSPTSFRTQKGEIAGSKTKSGYIEIGLDGTSYYAHRLAWLFVYGVLPSQIDHHDLDKSNNSFRNLRQASTSENKANEGFRSTNTSGVKGVCWSKRHQKWRAQITFRGRNRFLGHFREIEDAGAAYRSEAVRLFGDFARP